VRSLGIFGLVSLILVVVLGVYSCTILKQIEEVEKNLQDDYVAAAVSLRMLESREEKPKLDEWLRVRWRVTAVLEEGLKDKESITNLRVRRVRNDALEELAAALREEKIGFARYNELQRRWRALLARPEQAELKATWDKRVRVAESPDPLALPEPAKTVTDAEKKLLAEEKERLAATMEADKLTVLLEKIEAGE